MMSETPTTPGDWKREPLVWLLIAIPLSAVIMGAIMMTLAIQSYSGLVVDDYYKKGKQINRVLARDKLAHELGLVAGLKLQTDGSMEIRFKPEVQVIPGDEIVLELVHATMPGLDQKLTLHRTGSHRLTGIINLSGKVRWNIPAHPVQTTPSRTMIRSEQRERPLRPL